MSISCTKVSDTSMQRLIQTLERYRATVREITNERLSREANEIEQKRLAEEFKEELMRYEMLTEDQKKQELIKKKNK